MGLGIGYLLREVYFTFTFPAWVGDATLQFLPRWVRGLIFISAASAATVIGAWKLNHSIVSAVVPLDRQDELLNPHLGAAHPGAAARASSRSAAGPGSRRCCAGSRATTRTSPRS